MRKPSLALVGTALVCAVMAVAMIGPIFSRVRERARQVKAVSDVKGQGLAMLSYANDYDEAWGSLKAKRPGNSHIYQVSGVVRRSATRSGKDKDNSVLEDVETRSEASQPEEAGRNSTRWAPPTANTTPAAPDRYLIRNATLVIEVKDARNGYNTLFTAVKSARGYLSNLQETVDALGARTVTMQVRVPANLFDSSMQRLSSLGKVMEKHVNAEDVTEEYVDTQSTLRNLKKTEARLLEHLSRTGKLSDTLLVETELTRVRQEIEQHEGRIRFLSHRVQFSTMDVTLREEAKSQPAVPAESYSTGKEAAGATRSLVEFLRNVWTSVIWIGIWGVVWVPLTLIGWWAVRRAWRSWAGVGPTRTA